MLPTLADGGSKNLPAETRGSPEGIRQFALTVTMASPAEVLLLSAAAVLAGAMNAIAGGGTILTFPALLAFGMPAVQANATSTVALLVGAIGSAYGYREHLPAASLWIRRFGLVSIAGGFLGALLLTRTPADTFERLVPFLLLFATALFMTQSVFSRFAQVEAAAHSRHRLTSITLQFLVALYGGYFGAGIGILMLAVFGLMGLQDIHEMNTLKTVLSALINLVASIYFAFSGLVDWPRACVMITASVLGYFAGARLTQRISRERVRQLVTAIGLGISLVMFWKEFS
jgi:uncharacterized membrane protein YfcA